MQCERLLQLAKQWYLHVKEETMAPARMVQFIKQHVETCPVCQGDPDIQDEIEKITEIILPESKIPKAVRMKQEAEEAEQHEVEEVEDAEKVEDAKNVEDVEDVEDKNGEDSEENVTSQFSEEDEEEPLSPEAP